MNAEKAPANGEQVERALPWQTVGECAEWIERTRNRAFLNGARHEDISRAESVVLMSRLATLSTPTTDARERVKVLEEAIIAALACTPSIGVERGNMGQAVNYIQYDCGDPWEILLTALGNKEADRHG